MKVWCFVCVGEDGPDISVHTTRELAVISFQNMVHMWDGWNPRESDRMDDPTEPLEVCVWFDQHGSWTYDDYCYFLLQETELDDGTEPGT